MMPYFVLSFFPRDGLKEILDCIKSVSETYLLPTFSFFIKALISCIAEITTIDL